MQGLRNWGERREDIVRSGGQDVTNSESSNATLTLGWAAECSTRHRKLLKSRDLPGSHEGRSHGAWLPVLALLTILGGLEKLQAQSIVFSTYYGGSGAGTAVATDALGNAYQIGYSSSDHLACSGSLLGQQNILISKLNVNGTLAWCKYLGGTGTDYGYGIALDSSGNIYFAGESNSPNLGTAGAYQTTLMGTDDAIVGELDPNGNLLWLTYLGYEGESQANSVYVDSEGDVYVTGFTTKGWPVAGGVSQRQYGGGSYDATVARIEPGGATLAWSGYLGGSGNDVGYGVVLSPHQPLVCLGGYTSSSNFPVTSGAFQTTKNADMAGFAACLDPSTGATVSATYFGGSSTTTKPCNACIAGVSFDSTGRLWVVGLAQDEADFPITSNAMQPAFGGGLHDAFISALKYDLSTVLYSTWFGGSEDDGAVAITFDESGNGWVHGNTFSEDLPVTADAFQAHNGGPLGTSDAFLLKISPHYEIYATYLGGSRDEFGKATQSIAAGAGVIWFTGWTESTNFPLVAPLFETLTGTQSAFLAEATRGN
jgi:hypothetical protein